MHLLTSPQRRNYFQLAGAAGVSVFFLSRFFSSFPLMFFADSTLTHCCDTFSFLHPVSVFVCFFSAYKLLDFLRVWWNSTVSRGDVLALILLDFQQKPWGKHAVLSTLVSKQRAALSGFRNLRQARSSNIRTFGKATEWKTAAEHPRVLFSCGCVSVVMIGP